MDFRVSHKDSFCKVKLNNQLNLKSLFNWHDLCNNKITQAVIGVIMRRIFLEQVHYSVESNSLYYRVLSHANKMLCISVLGVLITLLISYPYAGYFSIPVQIFTHISTIVLAAIVKVSYVLRCVAQHGLGQEVR